LAAGIGAEGSVYVWRLPSGELVNKRPTEDGITALACSPDGKWLAVGERDGSVVITDISGKTAKTLAVASERINYLKLSPDGSLLAARVSDAPARLWNPVQGTPVAVLKTDFSGSRSMAFSPDSSLFATADSDTCIRIYDRSGKLKATYSGFLLEPFAITFIDGKQIVRRRSGLHLDHPGCIGRARCAAASETARSHIRGRRSTGRHVAVEFAC
jgi:WD40 repeat protein